MRLLALFVVLIWSQALPAQSAIELKSGNLQFLDATGVQPDRNGTIYNDRSYQFVRFTQPLTTSQQAQLQGQGLVLLEAMEDVYFISCDQDMPLTSFMVKPFAYAYFTSDLKISPYLDAARTSDAMVEVLVKICATKLIDQITRDIEKAGGTLLGREMQKAGILRVAIAGDAIEKLAKIPVITWIEPIPAPDEPIRYVSIPNQRVNTLHGEGYGLTGEGITIGVGDAGKVGRHIDLDGKLTNYSSYGVHVHATHVSGIVGGRPNLNPTRGVGVAPDASIVTSYFSQILLDAERHMRDHNMSVTNNSYGSSLNSCIQFGDYNLSSVFVDQQLATHDTLIHVFAAGNSGNATCVPFAKGFATILTGYQTSKNALCIGATNHIDQLAGFSSRGPVDDGRLKPDVVAVGSSVRSTRPNNTYGNGSGTSYSSPAVAGLSALLHQSYIALHGQKPPSALTKAVIMNTADDLGISGPDYKFGYGRVNARRAADLIAAGQFVLDSVSQGDSISLLIDVPANTAQLRVMLYWTDPAAPAYSTPALVNDLDALVRDPAEIPFLPWVLDPSVDLVNTAAIHGRDSLNNTEQITIDEPTAGSYTITTKGTSVPIGHQKYVIVYEFVPDAITVTYPNEKQTLRPGTSETIRWDAYGDAIGAFDLEYSYDGSTWHAITSGLTSSRRYYTWTVPDTAVDHINLRVSSAQAMDTSDHQLAILAQPGNLNLTSPCSDYAALSWNAVDGADQYFVYRYDGGEMTKIDSTAATTYDFAGLSPMGDWFSVSAASLAGNESMRATAVYITPSHAMPCTWPADIAVVGFQGIDNGRMLTSTQRTSSDSIRIQILNLGQDTASDVSAGYTINGGPAVLEGLSTSIAPGDTFLHTFSTPADLGAAGTYTIISWAKLLLDHSETNDTAAIEIRHVLNDPVGLPWIEGFEGSSDSTYLESAFAFDQLARWDYLTSAEGSRLRTHAGADFTSSGVRAVTMDNINYNTNSSHYITATVNLSAFDVAVDNLLLDFDMIHHEIQSDQDTNDRIWVRGTDTDLWVELGNLFDLHEDAGGLTAVRGLPLSDSLEAYGQNFSSSFQIKLGQQGTASADALTAEDGYTFDNFRIYNPGPDLSISEIVEPVINGCGLGVERISVMVKNSSDLEFNNVLMKYAIGTDTVSEMISSLAANDELLYGFDLPYDFSQSGIYHLTVWLEHAMDGNPNTDTLDASISSFIEIDSFPYREDFETGSGGWLASGKNHSFEMGIPSGEIISHAASGQQAWATNLAGAYNANETSYLTSPCFDLSAMTIPVLSFAHVYEIENNYDYLWVEYTEDGSNWIKLGSSGEGVNWYNDGGEQAWDDSDDMWHVTSIPIPTTAPRVQVRFVFTSDVGLQLEGTGIDAIHIHEQAPVYDGPATIDSAVVMGTGWTNFNIDGTRLASIHPNGQDLGVTTVEMYKFDGITRDDGTAYLADRNWTINSTNTPGSSVKLRLYMTHDEAIDLTNAFGCIDCAWSMDPFDLESFKYSGINEDSTVSNNTSGQNTFYDTAVVVFPYDNGYVIEFEIAGFSEFWITSPRVLRSDSTWYDLQAGSDDAEEFIVSGGTNPYGDTLRLNGSYKTGLRFPGINIPRGSFISDARLVLTASGYSDTTNIVIEGESTPYSSPFNTGNYNITGRPVTGSYSIWPGNEWLADTEYTSPQLRSIIQEIVDNNGWYPGFSLGIQLSGVAALQFTVTNRIHCWRLNCI